MLASLAAHGNLGSPANAGLMRYMNGKRFSDPGDFPWTMPFMPSDDAKGRLCAQNILKTQPDARIAVR